MTCERVVIALQKTNAGAGCGCKAKTRRPQPIVIGTVPPIRACTAVEALGAKRKEPPVNTPTSLPSTPLRATAPAPVPGIHLVHSSTPVVQRDRLIRLGQVEDLTGLKKSSIYAMVKDGTFPRQVVLSRRCSVWSEAAVLTWVQAHITAAQGAPLQGGA